MSDLRDLYQELILEHGKRPRNFKFPEHANRTGHGHNPLCGDRLILKLVVDGDVIKDAGFQGAGCAISTAAASTMTEVIKGKTIAEAHALFESFHALVTLGATEHDLGKLAAFSGVAEFPARVKCATLAWHTLESALAQKQEAAKTE